MAALTEKEMLARDLAARAVALGSSAAELGLAPAAADLVVDLCEWLRTKAGLNEEVIEATLPKLRAEQVTHRPVPLIRCVPAAHLGLRARRQVFSVHDLCVLRDEGGLSDVFPARVTSRKVAVALDAYAASKEDDADEALDGAPSAAPATASSAASAGASAAAAAAAAARASAAAAAASAGALTTPRRPTLPAEKARALLSEVRAEVCPPPRLLCCPVAAAAPRPRARPCTLRRALCRCRCAPRGATAPAARAAAAAARAACW